MSYWFLKRRGRKQKQGDESDTLCSRISVSLSCSIPQEEACNQVRRSEHVPNPIPDGNTVHRKPRLHLPLFTLAVRSSIIGWTIWLVKGMCIMWRNCGWFSNQSFSLLFRFTFSKVCLTSCTKHRVGTFTLWLCWLGRKCILGRMAKTSSSEPSCNINITFMRSSCDVLKEEGLEHLVQCFSNN